MGLILFLAFHDTRVQQQLVAIELGAVVLEYAYRRFRKGTPHRPAMLSPERPCALPPQREMLNPFPLYTPLERPTKTVID